MKNIAEKIKSLVSSSRTEPVVFQQLPFQFVKTQKSILKELVTSKMTGNVVGVYAKALGDGMFLTLVENIEPTPRTEIVTFNRYDMSGLILDRCELTLDEIQMVCPLNQKYLHPVLASPKAKKSGVNEGVA